MIEVIDVIDKELSYLDKQYPIKRLRRLKGLISGDKTIHEMIATFNVSKEKYRNQELSSKEFSIIKGKLYSHPLMNEYRMLYSGLNLSLIRFNKKISLLLHNKDCHCNIPLKKGIYVVEES